MNTTDYQAEIFKMISQIKSPAILKFIYIITKDAFNDWVSCSQ